MIEVIILVSALSIDSFLASFAYSSEGIRIPFRCACLIAGIGVGFLGISLYCADLVNNFLSPILCRRIYCIIFLLMGFHALFEGAIKRFLRHRRNKAMTLSFHNIRLVFDIYLDETKADVDKSKYLSVKEAVYLAIALSLDGLVSGFAFGIQITQPVYVLVVSFSVGLISLIVGFAIGERIGKKYKLDCSWLSGLLFLFLAGTRFLS